MKENKQSRSAKTKVQPVKTKAKAKKAEAPVKAPKVEPQVPAKKEKTPAQLVKAYTAKAKKAKSNFWTALVVFIICAAVMGVAIYNVLSTSDYYSMFYAIGLAFLVMIVCVFNMITEMKEYKTLMKAIEEPEKYSYLLVKEKPVYLDEDEKNRKHIGGGKKFWR